jgi:hypothetical protein
MLGIADVDKFENRFRESANTYWWSSRNITRNSFLKDFTDVEQTTHDKAKRSFFLVSKDSRKSNNVNKNKHELYFRFLAFNKKEEEKKGEGTKQDIDKRKNEELGLLKKEKGIIRENCG